MNSYTHSIDITIHVLTFSVAQKCPTIQICQFDCWRAAVVYLVSGAGAQTQTL